MKILSFCEYRHNWVEVEIEVSLIPGLPQMHLLGLPDPRVKESLLKIKSALKIQGFELPKSKQILVNIRGGDFKKTSRGLDLAIAVAILNQTQQIRFSKTLDKFFVFGELGLSGQVLPFEDIMMDELWRVENLITGQGMVVAKNHIQIQSLRDVIEAIKLTHGSVAEQISSKAFDVEKMMNLKAPDLEELGDVKLTESQARLLEIVSVGQHSLLLMGPRGLGKTTMAECLHYLSSKPEVKHYLHQRKYFPKVDKKFWRPFVRPHHSVSHLALIGGGSDCSPGEISRAHGGILLLDEMLEFSPSCQEALREPLQNKEVHLVRGKRVQSYPCDFQLVGTTNLCPCGQWLPGVHVDCHFSVRKCGQYKEKLSGPMLDRFHVLYFLKSSQKNQKTIPITQVKVLVDKAREFKERLSGKGLTVAFDSLGFSESLNIKITQELSSLRRLNASIEVAKTIALLEGSESVQEAYFEEALSYTWDPFLDLKI